jgi:hypothetical protein
MKYLSIAIITVAMSAGITLPARAAERLSDKQVKATVENVQRGFEKWKDALEKRNLDDAVIKNAAGTIDVKKFLKDFKDEIDLVKDRLKPEYAANPEMTTVLRRASDVERRARQQTTKPMVEWQEMAAQFAFLAASYGTTFPTPSADAVALRWSDQEVAAKLEDIERQSKTTANEADKALKQAKAAAPDRAKVKQALAAVGANAKQARSGINAGTATMVQAETLLKSITAAGEVLGSVSMSGPGKTAWEMLGNDAAVVAKAFGAP